MTADPRQVLRILGHRDIDIRIVDGQLEARWRHGDQLPADMVDFIQYFRSMIVAELAEAREQEVAA